MHLWNSFRRVPKVSDHSVGNRSQPRPEIRNTGDEVPYLYQRSPTTLQTPHCPQPVPQQINRQMQALLPGHKEEWNWLLLRWTVWSSVPKSECSSGVSSTPIQTSSRWNVVPLSHSLWYCRERGFVREDESIQKPVYYVSKSLIDAQTRYTRIEKLIFALFVTTRKLKHYFQFFPIIMLTEYPLRTIVKNLEATGRIAKWVTRSDLLESHSSRGQ